MYTLKYQLKSKYLTKFSSKQQAKNLSIIVKIHKIGMETVGWLALSSNNCTVVWLVSF